MDWTNRCPPWDTQYCALTHTDVQSCEAESFCHIFYMITGIRISPRALAVMAHLEIAANRNCAHILDTVNSMGVVLWNNCPTPISFTMASYYTPLTAQESQAFPITAILIAADLNKSPLWTELEYGPNLAIPTRHMVAQINDTQYFDSEAGAPIKEIAQTTTLGLGPPVIAYQISILITKGVRMLVFFQVIGEATIWSLMDGEWVGFADETAFSNYIAGRPNTVIQLAQTEFAKLLSNSDVFKS